MKGINKMVSLLLMAALLFVPVLSVAEEANTAGAYQETAFNVTAQWHPIADLGEETNKVITSVFDAIEITGRYGENNGTGYSSFVLNMSGEEALKFDAVVTEEGFYTVNDLLGQPMAIAQDEMRSYFSNLGAYMDAAVGEYGDVPLQGSYQAMFDELFKSLEGGPEAMASASEDMMTELMGEYEEIFATLDMEGYIVAVQDWLRDVIVQGELYEGPIGSVFGVETEKAMVYPLTKQNLKDFIGVVRGLVEGNEDFFRAVSKMQGYEMSDEELESIMQELPAEFDGMIEDIDSMSDDIVMRYNQCLGADGEVVTNQIEFIKPADENGYNEVTIMAEWLPEIIPFYLSLLVDGDGMQMSISENGEVSEGVMDEGVTLNLVVLDDDEVTEEVYISVSSIAGSDAQTGADLWEGGLTFIYSDLRYEQEMGAQLWINQVTQTQDDAVTKDAVIDLSVLMNGTDYPVLTVTANTQQQAAGDLPFEVDDFNFVHPGAMDEEAFTEYMGTVQAAAMQAMLKVVSLLPPEVFEAMNTTTSTY